MKHARPIAMLLLFILLCASLAYWGMRMFTPAPRPHAPPQERPPASVEAASKLFGGNAPAAVGSAHYQLKGIVNADGANSVAIISANGQPARAIRIGGEVAPGVTVSEVHAKHVLLSENGVPRRLELSEIPKKAASAASSAPARPASASPTTTPRPAGSPRYGPSSSR